MTPIFKLVTASAACLCAAHGVLAQSTPAAPSPRTSTVPADNSENNRLNQNKAGATADSQKNDDTDLTLTRNIRRSIVADKTLSTYGHNVKIVAVDGTVTLNGVVRSEAEKAAIQSKAADVAGEAHVVNALKVSPPR